ncbi:MAG: hypothetical protein ABIP75_20080 [Pyrinomonadaceae bacterium]
MNKLALLVAVSALMALILGIYLYKRHPVVLKVAVGSARVINSRIQTAVRIDGIDRPDAQCFAVNSSFHGQPTDLVILVLPNDRTASGVDPIVVDRGNRSVGSVNSNELDYYLLWGKYLFQSESGSTYVSFGSAKGYEQDPQLRISDHTIDFILPADYPLNGGKSVNIEF